LRQLIGSRPSYLLEPLAAWAPESSDELLYLSDIDDFDPGHEAPQRLYDGDRTEATRRYGMRFTLDLP